MKKDNEYICVMGVFDQNYRQMVVLLVGVFKERNQAEDAYDIYLINYIQSLVDGGEDIDDIDSNYEFEMYIFNV